jgi:hypothetical protein
MKLLFFSVDDREVANVSKEFTDAGILCEVRREDSNHGLNQPACSELWIRHDRDCHRALMLCVQLGVGFARRAPRKSFIESWSEISSGTAPLPEETERMRDEQEPTPENGEEEMVHAPRLRRSRAA